MKRGQIAISTLLIVLMVPVCSIAAPPSRHGQQAVAVAIRALKSICSDCANGAVSYVRIYHYPSIETYAAWSPSSLKERPAVMLSLDWTTGLGYDARRSFTQACKDQKLTSAKNEIDDVRWGVDLLSDDKHKLHEIFISPLRPEVCEIDGNYVTLTGTDHFVEWIKSTSTKCMSK